MYIFSQTNGILTTELWSARAVALTPPTAFSFLPSLRNSNRISADSTATILSGGGGGRGGVRSSRYEEVRTTPTIATLYFSIQSLDSSIFPSHSISLTRTTSEKPNLLDSCSLVDFSETDFLIPQARAPSPPPEATWWIESGVREVGDRDPCFLGLLCLSLRESWRDHEIRPSIWGQLEFLKKSLELAVCFRNCELILARALGDQMFS